MMQRRDDDAAIVFPGAGIGSPASRLGTGIKAGLRRSLRFCRRKPLGALGAFIVLGLLITAAIGPGLMPEGINEVKPGRQLQDPSWSHLLGTDEFGRDVFSRIVHGSRITVFVGFGASLISLVAGTMLGLAAGSSKSWVDLVIQRFVDAILAIPGVLLLLSIVSIVKPGLWTVTVVLGLLVAVPTSRVIRSSVLSFRESAFVQAARASGATDLRVMLRHLLPNLAPLMLVLVTAQLGGIVLAEASLSFLGFGLPPPQPSWGGMLQTSRPYFLTEPLLAVWPGLALSSVVFAWNVFGDALRDTLDPYLRGR